MKRLIFTTFSLFLLLTSLVFASGKSQSSADPLPEYFVEYINMIPDMTQTDPRAKLPQDGNKYCAPVAVSNSLIFLGKMGFPKLIPRSSNIEKAQFKLAKLLGSEEYMGTILTDGTSPNSLFKGVAFHLEKCGYMYKRFEYQGWRDVSEKIASDVEEPDMNWIKRGMLNKSAVWLNIGFYTYDSDTDKYTRFDGHWVTAVGYGKNTKGRTVSNVIILHDPASRAGTIFSNEHVRYIQMTQGTLCGKKNGLPHSAAGYYKLTTGMHIKKGADACILDGAIVMEM